MSLNFSFLNSVHCVHIFQEYAVMRVCTSLSIAVRVPDLRVCLFSHICCDSPQSTSVSSEHKELGLSSDSSNRNAIPEIATLTLSTVRFQRNRWNSPLAYLPVYSRSLMQWSVGGISLARYLFFSYINI